MTDEPLSSTTTPPTDPGGGLLGQVERIARYPVKSMLGEELDECVVTPVGLAGDRAYALVDRSDGVVVSAKNPRKWGRLLEFRASYVEPPADGAGVRAPVEIVFPDGSARRSDHPSIDDALSRALGRDVTLATTAPDDRRFEEVWPAIDGLAPEEYIAGTTHSLDPDGLVVSKMSLGMLSPPGCFFDLSVLHLLTTSTLAALAAAAPEATFDWRRYRPNLVVATRGQGFVENDWVGRDLTIGETVVEAHLRTMRCVMTTLAQGDLPADRDTLRTIARVNRVEVSGLGEWACAGVYAGVRQPGRIQRGDRVAG